LFGQFKPSRAKTDNGGFALRGRALLPSLYKTKESITGKVKDRPGVAARCLFVRSIFWKKNTAMASVNRMARPACPCWRIRARQISLFPVAASALIAAVRKKTNEAIKLKTICEL
jgi:hypothetical protein